MENTNAQTFHVFPSLSTTGYSMDLAYASPSIAYHRIHVYCFPSNLIQYHACSPMFGLVSIHNSRTTLQLPSSSPPITLIFCLSASIHPITRIAHIPAYLISIQALVKWHGALLCRRLICFLSTMLCGRSRCYHRVLACRLRLSKLGLLCRWHTPLQPVRSARPFSFNVHTVFLLAFDQ